jgi:hypothetical protein
MIIAMLKGIGATLIVTIGIISFFGGTIILTLSLANYLGWDVLVGLGIWVLFLIVVFGALIGLDEFR